jgi:hypothetical protein
MEQITPLLRLVVALVLAGSSVGCTFTHVQPAFVTAPPQQYAVITVGAITTADTLWTPLMPHFRRGLLQGLRELQTFDTVLDATAGTVVPSSVVLSGQITAVDKGSEALRWFVGHGAGRAQVRGQFMLSTASGTPLTVFAARESYAGGIGLGGPGGFLDLEDLLRRFGGTIAAKTGQWARGAPLE